MFNNQLQYLLNWYNWGSLQTKYFESVQQAKEFIEYFSIQGVKFNELRLFDTWNKKVIEL